MADESTHPEDHDPDQAAPDSADVKGQEETLMKFNWRP
jgi:hypothetical protein